MHQVASRMGVTTSYVDLSGPGGPARLKAAMTPRTKLVMCESPTNPMMRICDLAALAAVIRSGCSVIHLPCWHLTCPYDIYGFFHIKPTHQHILTACRADR